MGSSPSADFAWSIDLGDIGAEIYDNPKFEGLKDLLVDEGDVRRIDEYEEEIELKLQDYSAVQLGSYGYEYSSYFLYLKRSYSRAYNWSSEVVRPDSLAMPTSDERKTLLEAAQAIGYAATDEDIALNLYPSYS